MSSWVTTQNDIFFPDLYSYTNEKAVIFTGGPYRCRKNRVILSIAEKYHTSIISSDSRQLYKDLKIYRTY